VASTTKSLTRQPFAAMVRYTDRHGAKEVHTLHCFSTLKTACGYVTTVSLAWARLIGFQPSPLYWYVLDRRDYTEWHSGIPLSGGSNGNTTIEGRNWHSRPGR
jgi:hypothetical protein